MQQSNDARSMPFRDWEEFGIDVAKLVCDVISQPVRILIRPWYSTRYFTVAVQFLAFIMVILLVGFLGFFTSAVRVIPFMHIPAPVGMFGFGSFANLYFLASVAHGFRTWRRMLHPETELYSEFEGPALPFFQLLPYGKSFWFVRIIWEPLFVWIAATVLQDLYIIQSGLATYIHLAALALLMGQWIAWYRSWLAMRKMLDMRNTGPLLNKLGANEATDEELAQIHLAAFPKETPPDIRQATANYIANAFTKSEPER